MRIYVGRMVIHQEIGSDSGTETHHVLNSLHSMCNNSIEHEYLSNLLKS